MTLDDIVNNPVLKTKVISKNANLYQSVQWAHVCELIDPTEWLGDGDLLMTTGIGIPYERTEQIQYIQRLHEAKLVGIVIGENMQGPEDILALLEEAEKLGFCVLSMAYEIPFSAITKLISNDKEHQDYVKRTGVMQVYETARLGIQGVGLEQLLYHLQQNIKSSIYLIESSTAQPWASELAKLPQEVIHALLNSKSREKDNVAIMQRLIVENEEWLKLDLPIQNEASIVVKKGKWIDYILLSHVAAVIGIELERTRFEYENTLRLGVEAFDELLQKRLPHDYIIERLRPFCFDLTHSVIFSMKSERPLLNKWNEILCRNGIRALFKKQPNRVLGLIEDVALLPKLQALLECPIGFSSVIGNAYRVPEAVHESQLALAFCTDSKKLVAYDTCSTKPFWIPQNLDIARQVYEDVLGELEKYDLANNAKLIFSLKTFLECNKSWQYASEKLHIHKQSLIYRIKKVEEITHRSVNNIDDVTIFWFAIKSGVLIGK